MLHNLTASTSTSGSNNSIQFNNNSSLGGADNVYVDSGDIMLAVNNSATTPSSGNVKLITTSNTGVTGLNVVEPNGLITHLQASLGQKKVSRFITKGNSTTTETSGLSLGGIGTATSVDVDFTNMHMFVKHLDYRAASSSTAVAGLQGSSKQYGRGDIDRVGGVTMYVRFGPSIGIDTATTYRMFCGFIRTTSSPSDSDPSGQTDCVGVGIDTADTNLQFMHNDASGSATKVDLGANFVRDIVPQTKMYQLILHCKANGDSYYYNFTDLSSNVTTSGSVSSDIPAKTTLLTPRLYISVAGVTTAIGMAIADIFIESDY